MFSVKHSQEDYRHGDLEVDIFSTSVIFYLGHFLPQSWEPSSRAFTGTETEVKYKTSRSCPRLT